MFLALQFYFISFNEVFDGPFDGPFDEPFDGPFDEPFDGPFDEPLDGPFDEPFDGPFDGPFDEPIPRLGSPSFSRYLPVNGRTVSFARFLLSARESRLSLGS